MKVRHAFGADSGKLLQTMVAGLVVLASPVLVNGQESLFIEDFASGVGAMTAGVECGSGSQWLGDTFCTPNTEGSGSPWARFGVGFDGCADYSDGNVTAYMTTPELDTQGCQQLSLRFRYLLDFDSTAEENIEQDRARVILEREVASEVQLANNGYSLQQIQNCSGRLNLLLPPQLLLNDATWRQLVFDLDDIGDLGDTIRVRFEGETTDSGSKLGEGFLVDDVRITCSRLGHDLQANSYTTGDQTLPDVAPLGEGFVVVWQGALSDVDADTTVRGQIFTAQGLPVGEEFPINSQTLFHQSRPAVADDPGGGFVVVWKDSNDDSVAMRRFASDATPLGDELHLSAGLVVDDDSRVDVGADGDGDFIVVWGAYQDIWSHRFSSAGAPVGSYVRLNAYTTDEQLNPVIAVEPDGDFVVAWQSYGSPGDSSGSSVRAARFSSSGSTLAPEFQVNQYTTSHQRRPAIAVEEDGTFVVSYDGANPTTNIGVTTRRFAGNGDPIGAELVVGNYTSDTQLHSDVALLPDGSALAVFNTDDLGPFPADIGGRLTAGDGHPLGSPFVVNGWTEADQDYPAVATLASGDFVVAWKSESSPAGPDNQAILFRVLAGPNSIFRDGFESGDSTAWSLTTP